MRGGAWEPEPGGGQVELRHHAVGDLQRGGEAAGRPRPDQGQPPPPLRVGPLALELRVLSREPGREMCSHAAEILWIL